MFILKSEHEYFDDLVADLLFLVLSLTQSFYKLSLLMVLHLVIKIILRIKVINGFSLS